MERREQLDKIFENVEDDKKQLVCKLLDEVVFLENQLSTLKTLPFVNVHPNNPALQKTTPAAKLYKECSQSYMNAIRILSGILNKVETTAQDELMKMLEDYE